LTYTSLRYELPTLEPDDAFVRRLAELALASRTSPASGVAVFRSTTTRSLAAAAAVAAIAAGAAAAANQMTHSRPLPGPPITTRGTDSPQSPEQTSGTHHGDGHHGRQIGVGAPHEPTSASTDDTLPTGTSTDVTTTGDHLPGPGPSSPGQVDSGDDGPSDGPTDGPTDSPSGGPTDDGGGDTSDGDDGSDNSGSGDGGSDGSSDGSGPDDGSGSDGSSGSGGSSDGADVDGPTGVAD
jgi:uncharacterized membrane protein YgcG